MRAAIRRFRFGYHATLIAGGAWLAACASATESEQSVQRYGAANFTGKRTADGKVRASATVVAFESPELQVPNSSLQQNEQCVFAAVDTVPTPVRGDRSAGDAVAVRIGGVTTPLSYTAAEFRYGTAAASPIMYSAGDVAQVSIPGSGSAFPAITGEVKLAEPIELGPLVLPPVGENFTVTWNGTNDATSAIILQLKYPSPPTASFANEQVYCALRDDGSAVLPGGLLNSLQAANSKRSFTLVRWRTNLVSTSGAKLHLTTSVDTTVVLP